MDRWKIKTEHAKKNERCMTWGEGKVRHAHLWLTFTDNHIVGSVIRRLMSRPVEAIVRMKKRSRNYDKHIDYIFNYAESE